MQKVVFVLVMMVSGSVAVQAQSLKDALYGGKLKMDSNAVLRKTDDIKARIDTAQKKPVELVKPIASTSPMAIADSGKMVQTTKDSAASSFNTESNTTAVVADESVKGTTTPLKTNTKIIKEHSDALVNTLRSEVLTNKKIKKESYFVLVAYEMDTTSQVSVTNVTTTPTNALLQSEILQRLQNDPPKLNPMLDSAGKPRKIKRTYSFTVVKD